MLNIYITNIYIDNFVSSTNFMNEIQNNSQLKAIHRN